jgi:hypothetical protein
MRATLWWRYTIGQLMLMIAAAGGVLAISRRIQSPTHPIALGILGLLGTVALLYAAIGAIIGGVCPTCSRRTLRRLARHRHYYRCSACRARFKRFGSGPWLDASGPEDAARYRKPTDAGIWKGFSVPTAKDLKGSNSGVLLGSKRSRDPLDVVKQYPPRRDPGRRLEQAERKVRAFLKRRHEEPEE